MRYIYKNGGYVVGAKVTANPNRQTNQMRNVCYRGWWVDSDFYKSFATRKEYLVNVEDGRPRKNKIVINPLDVAHHNPLMGMGGWTIK